MVCAGKGERQRNTTGASAAGQPLAPLRDNPAVAVGDPDHPARLRVGDLENPDQFHSRLKAWLLKQG